jgi:Domain of unknown function (DUF4157)
MKERIIYANNLSPSIMSSRQPFFFQPRLTLNNPNDNYEMEADAMADKVMRMQQPFIKAKPLPINSIQRKCAECDEEEKKPQRKEMVDNETTADRSLERYIGNLTNSGRSLPDEVRSFFEPRFDYDFNNVKVHTDHVAAKSAQSINAVAYTSGSNIVFNAGQYSPGTDRGKRLLAHELTHVVQQNESVQPKKIQRALGRFTRCAANVHNAPADPLAVIRQMNDRAELMSLGASHLLFSESLFIQSATFGPSSTLGFYRRRFGDPVASGTKFKNRFNNTLHNTLVLAQASELQFLSLRMQNISRFLGRNLHFKCTGTSHTTIGSCSHHCNAGNALATCSSGHGNTVAVCPDFWTFGSLDQQSIGLIHEVLHMTHGMGDRDTVPFAQTAGQRRGEPECYASLVADIYGIAPQDPSCPVI